jgi:hypothetical protein
MSPLSEQKFTFLEAWLLFGLGNWFARKWTYLVFVQTNRKPIANQPQTNPEVSGAKGLRSFGALDRPVGGTQTKRPAGPAAGCSGPNGAQAPCPSLIHFS